MSTQTLQLKHLWIAGKNKMSAYLKILKVRLTLIVSLSAAFGYAMAAGDTFSWMMMIWITLGGFLVTGASNILNQIFEKEYDAVMKRTFNRPLPQGNLSFKEAIIFALLLVVLGVWILGYHFNLPAALLSIIGLLLYAFVYTPMKRYSPFAVFVGAIPGALPPLIGWAAVTGGLDKGGLVLFAFQFFWQFPHFWAIAWVLNDDYLKAGFQLLPSASGRSRESTRLILVYTLMLIPMVILPFQMGMLSIYGMIILLLLGMGFTWVAFDLHRKLDDKVAKRLLFSSFLYLPLMQLTFLLA